MLLELLVAVLLIPVITIILCLWGLIWSIPLMYAWNYTMPAIFGLPQITYWQTFCLYVIVSSLWKVSYPAYRGK